MSDDALAAVGEELGTCRERKSGGTQGVRLRLVDDLSAGVKAPPYMSDMWWGRSWVPAEEAHRVCVCVCVCVC